LKVAVLDSWFHWPPRGGGIRDIKEVSTWLSKRGHRVILLMPHFRGRGTTDEMECRNFDLVRVRFSYNVHFNGPCFEKEMRKALVKVDPDVVLIANGNGLKPYMILSAKDYPVIVRLYSYELLCPAQHGVLFRESKICPYNFVTYPHRCAFCWNTIGFSPSLDWEFLRCFSFLYPFYHIIVKESLGYPAGFIVTSVYMKRRFSEIIPRRKLHIIPSGVDPDQFKPISSETKANKRIFFPGRASDPLKGIGVLLKAGQILWKKRDDFRILVTSEIPYEAPFIERIGWKSERSIGKIYATCDLVVVPSIWAEPFGLTALEAMSAGKAVIASEVGGIPEFLENGKNGITVQPNNPEVLALKIDELLDKDEYRQKLGGEARETVLRRYQWSQIVDEYVSVIHSLAS